ncbi:MAG: peptidyl-prolyl cis-trans isomerase [Proteobacteria bacterium]|nr:peptidyl-prolyl cis-trans isomerase [Pseudomonadota bacterium]
MTKRITSLLTTCLILITFAGSAAMSDSNPKALFETSQGNITIELYAEKAPITVENFIRYVKEGFYDDTIFHRVIPNFMVQGGSFKVDMRQKDGHANIQNEANNGLKNVVGSLAMARTSAPHSASSQFFINVADNGFLNFTSESSQGWGYAVFAQVVDGMDVVMAIAEVETATLGPHGDVPKEPIIVNKASMIE